MADERAQLVVSFPTPTSFNQVRILERAGTGDGSHREDAVEERGSATGRIEGHPAAHAEGRGGAARWLTWRGRVAQLGGLSRWTAAQMERATLELRRWGRES